jgi:hypothetical protein
MSAQDESVITEILTNPKLRAAKAMLEKDHAIDCLFLLHMDKGRWKQAKEYMNKNGLTLSDGTFRSRMIEIEHNGFATSTQLDPLKKHYHIAPKGRKLTTQLLKLLQQQL